MPRVLVTGAEGFAGTHLLRCLRQKGYDVVAGVRNRARKLAFERDQVHALVCEITDPINVARVVASARPDAVVHLAGTSRADLAAGDPLAAYQAIVSAWANVLDAVRRTVPRARILLISAADVYGAAVRDDRPLTEATQPVPISTFGSLKLAAEDIARTFHREYHLDLTIARPFQYTGAGEPRGTLLGTIARRLADWGAAGTAGQLRVPELNCRRDWLHVEDVATAYERLLRDGRPNEVYNVCSGHATSNAELIAGLAGRFGCNPTLVEEPAEAGREPPRVVCGDNSRLRGELGWRPERTLDEALDELAGSYRVELVGSAP